MSKIKIKQLKSILVSGATGFRGSRLVELLIEKQYNALSIVRNEKNSNFKSKFIVGDISDLHFKIMTDSLDCIFHLASHSI